MLSTLHPDSEIFKPGYSYVRPGRIVQAEERIDNADGLFNVLPTLSNARMRGRVSMDLINDPTKRVMLAQKRLDKAQRKL